MPELIPVWAASGALAVPDATKIAQGWFLAEKPPHEWMNWWMNLLTQRVNHVLQNGVAGWDSSVLYPVGAFTRQSGLLYRAIAENINKAPSSSPDDWLQISQNASSLTAGALPNARLTGNYNQVTNFTISGKLIANEFAGNGNGLTNLNASQLGSGNVPNARLTNSYTNIINLTASGTVKAGGFSGPGTGITTLDASNLTAGTVPNARMDGNYSFNALTLSGLLTADRATLANWLSVGSNITAVGNVTANNFVGSGSGLTGLNASQLSTGIVPNSRMSGGYSFDSLSLSATLSVVGAATFGSINDTPIGLATPRAGKFVSVETVNNAVVGGNITVTGNISGANISGNLNADQLSSGTVDAARLPETTAANGWVGTRYSMIGPYALGIVAFATDTVARTTSYGQTRPGADLRPSNSEDNLELPEGNLGAGTTWRCLGYSRLGTGDLDSRTTLWQRVS